MIDSDSDDEDSTSSSKHVKIIYTTNNQKEKSKWDKLPIFLCKVILYVSSKGELETIPSENYIEFLNFNSVKLVLLLVLSVAVKEQIAYCMH